MDRQKEADFNELLKKYLQQSLTPEELNSFLDKADQSGNQLLLERSYDKTRHRRYRQL